MNALDILKLNTIASTKTQVALHQLRNGKLDKLQFRGEVESVCKDLDELAAQLDLQGANLVKNAKSEMLSTLRTELSHLSRKSVAA